MPAYLDPPYTVTERLLAWQRKGLTWTATGYGSKIPSPYVLTYQGRTYRVYAICYSNAATYYVIRKGQRWYLRDHELEAARDAGRIA